MGTSLNTLVMIPLSLPLLPKSSPESGAVVPVGVAVDGAPEAFHLAEVSISAVVVGEVRGEDFLLGSGDDLQHCGPQPPPAPPPAASSARSTSRRLPRRKLEH